MRLTHGYPIALLMAAFVALQPAFAAPQRIVSTFLCTDEYVFRLAPRAHIAALSFLAADNHPVVSTIRDAVKGIPLIRGSAEEVLSLKPDLVVMYQATNPRLKAHLVEAHIPILEVPWANSLADIRKITRDLGNALGEPERANALIAHMDTELADASAHAVHPPVRTLIYEPNGYAASDAVTDGILGSAGLSDISRSMGQTRAGTIPVEEIVVSPPELLILNGEPEKLPARGELILQHPALRNLPASTLVAHATLTPLLCPGPWSADVLPTLTREGREARRLASAAGAH